MNDQTIIILVNAIIAILIILGVWVKLSRNLQLIKEWLDVLVAALAALKDGNLSDEEMAQIKKELEEARNFKSLKENLKKLKSRRYRGFRLK